jgi:hypothetical protein
MGGLVVDRAAALLSAKPQPIDAAIDTFHREWTGRAE